MNYKKAKGLVVVVTNVVTNETVNQNSISEAARDLNVNRYAISRYIKNQKVLNGKYKFSYLQYYN